MKKSDIGKETYYYLISILAAISFLIGSLAIGISYYVSFEQQRERLIETVQSQARLIEAMAKFDAKFSAQDHPEGAYGATLSQVVKAHGMGKGFGETGEFVLARREGNQIVFLLSHRFLDMDTPRPVPFDADIAEPMRLALKGESGSIEGLDYRGELVLAAYEPVNWSGHQIGIVAKIDIAEIRQPFAIAGLITGLLAFIILGFGMFVFNRLTRPFDTSDSVISLGRKTDKYLHLAAPVLLATVILYADISIPLGVAGGVPYVALFLFSILSPTRFFIISIGILGTIMTVVGFFLSPEGGLLWMALLNRFLAIFAIWITAILTLYHKEAEIKAVDNARNLEKSQEIANIGSFDWNIKVNEISWSDETYKIFGRNPQEFNPTLETFLDAIHPEDRKIVKQAVDESVRNDTPIDIEYRIVRPDNEERVVHALAIVYRDDSGKPIRLLGTAHDITERKEAEESLSASEQKFRALAQSASDAIITTDSDGKIVTWNSAAETIFGYSENEALSQTIITLIPERYHEKHSRAFEQASLTGKLKNPMRTIEVEGVKNDGAEFSMELSISCWTMDKNLFFTSIIRDITDRKKAEEELFKYRNHLEELVNNRTDEIKLIQKIAVAANEALTVDEAMLTCIGEVCGYTGWEIGHVYIPDAEGICIPTDLWHVKKTERFDAFLKATMNTAFEPGVGLPGRVYKSGEPAWVRDVTNDTNFPRAKTAEEVGMKAGFAFPVLGGGNVVAVLEFFTTIAVEPDQLLLDTVKHLASQLGRLAERKRTERELLLKNYAIDSSMDAMMMTNLDYEITYMNQKMCELWGYAEKELLGCDNSILRAEEHLKGTIQKIVFEKGEYEGEFLARRKDGSTFIAHVSTSMVEDENGKIVSNVTSFIDLTERIRNEEALVSAKEAAEAATKLKDKFVSLASHDLRSPLSTITGFLNFMKFDTKNPLCSEHKDIVNRMILTTDHQLNMIDGLLDLTRMKTGYISLEPRFANTNLIVENIVQNMLFMAQAKEITLVNDIPANARLYADITYFSQVVSNLVSNAIKFCSKGDSVRLFAPDNKKSIIAVSDTGAGIDSQTLCKLFTQEDKTSIIGTAGEEGFGLGLPYSYEIMQAHGGSLYAESTIGEGAVFFAKLPYVKPQLLIVDDDEKVRKLIMAYVDPLDVYVKQAVNGSEAIETLKLFVPHLIITDISMPVIDGLQLLEHIRGNPAIKSVPVIIMTGTDIHLRDKAFQMQASDFITKPLMEDEFLPRIRRFIG
ncbi:hypothetical protein MNBD_NITROSPINAE04-148 [hydrothermal vent metagenome]|uniref:histidine kinase n=1 Tax=hydrothermal vent metagenome TaxID=652676 RepID=A0A3B1BU03_9ZZZZ